MSSSLPVVTTADVITEEEAEMETTPLKIVDVQTEYLDYFTWNIQSFGSILICVVSDIDETGKRALNLVSQ